MNNFDQKFWGKRSRNYDSLDWIHRSGYLDKFIQAGDFSNQDSVLDIGTGTGIIAFTVSPRVKGVIGIDASPEMLEHAQSKNQAPNVEFQIGDVRDLDFPDSSFDKITARMVFHHVLDNIEQGISECFRVLKPGGTFLLSEGVPPNRELREWYSEMFAYKEERRTFLESDLMNLVNHENFSNVSCQCHISDHVSIGNWLDNGAVSDENKKIIINMHLDLNEFGKNAYKMKVADDDIFIDIKFVIVKAIK